MKVLQINSVCGVGSTGKICQDLYWELKNRGHDCKIAWGRRKGGNVPDEDTIQIGKPIDYYWHALSTRIFDNTGFCSKKATENFIENISAYDPDVIHLHNIHGYYVNVTVLFDYLRQCGKKIIWTLHDCWSFTGHCTHMDFVGCDKWKKQCFNCPQKKSYPKSDLFDRSKLNYIEKKKLFTNIDNLCIVTPSYWLAGLVRESFLKDYPVSVIHNGIDTSVFKPVPSDIRMKYHLENKVIVLGVAYQWTASKGYEDMQEIAERLPSDRFQVVLVGITKKQKEQGSKKILGILKTDSVEELVKWYSVADIFVNTTYQEVLGLTNLEAQACGTLCITYNTGGCPECTDINDGNVKINKGDIENLLNVIAGVRMKSDSNAAQVFRSEYDNNFYDKYIAKYFYEDRN